MSTENLDSEYGMGDEVSSMPTAEGAMLTGDWPISGPVSLYNHRVLSAGIQPRHPITKWNFESELNSPIHSETLKT